MRELKKNRGRLNRNVENWTIHRGRNNVSSSAKNVVEGFRFICRPSCKATLNKTTWKFYVRLLYIFSGDTLSEVASISLREWSKALVRSLYSWTDIPCKEEAASNLNFIPCTSGLAAIRRALSGLPTFSWTLYEGRGNSDETLESLFKKDLLNM